MPVQIHSEACVKPAPLFPAAMDAPERQEAEPVMNQPSLSLCIDRTDVSNSTSCRSWSSLTDRLSLWLASDDHPWWNSSISFSFDTLGSACRTSRSARQFSWLWSINEAGHVGCHFTGRGQSLLCDMAAHRQLCKQLREGEQRRSAFTRLCCNGTAQHAAKLHPIKVPSTWTQNNNKEDACVHGN